MLAELQDAAAHEAFDQAITAAITDFKERHGGRAPVVLELRRGCGVRTEMAIRAGAERVLVVGSPLPPPPDAGTIEFVDDVPEEPVADVLVCGLFGPHHSVRLELDHGKRALRSDPTRYCVPQNLSETMTPCSWTHDDDQDAARAVLFGQIVERFASKGLVWTGDSPVLPVSMDRIRFEPKGPTTLLPETRTITTVGPNPVVAIGWTATLWGTIRLDNTPEAYRDLDPVSKVGRAVSCGFYIASGMGARAELSVVSGFRSIYGAPVFRLETPDTGAPVWSNEFKATRHGQEAKWLMADVATASLPDRDIPSGTLFFQAPAAAVLAATRHPDRRYLLVSTSMIVRGCVRHDNIAVANTVNRLHTARDKVMPLVINSCTHPNKYPRPATEIYPVRTKEAVAVRFDPVAMARKCCPQAMTAAIKAIQWGMTKGRPFSGSSWPLWVFPWIKATPAWSGGKLVVAQHRVGELGASGIFPGKNWTRAHAMATAFGPEKVIRL